MIKFLMRYFIWDYLMDEKQKIDILQKRLSRVTKAKDFIEADLIKDQINSIKLNIVESYQRYSKQCPRSVLDWALGKRKTPPTKQQILEESSQMYMRKARFKDKFFVYIAAVLLLAGAFWLFVKILTWLLT